MEDPLDSVPIHSLRLGGYSSEATYVPTTFVSESNIQKAPERLGLNDMSHDSTSFMEWELIEVGSQGKVTAREDELLSKDNRTSPGSCPQMVGEVLGFEARASPSSSPCSSQECTAPLNDKGAIGSPPPDLSEMSGIMFSDAASNQQIESYTLVDLPTKEETSNKNIGDRDQEADNSGKHLFSGPEQKKKSSRTATKRSSLKILDSDHENHIWTERERRKKMRTMFTTLHSVLGPRVAPKADKSTILDEAISYIKQLEQTRQRLLRKKSERCLATTPSTLRNSALLQGDIDPFTVEDLLNEPQPKAWFGDPPVSSSGHSFETWSSSWSFPSVVLNVCGAEGLFNICTGRRPAFLSSIFNAVVKNNLDVVTAHISANEETVIYMIYAHARGSSEAARRDNLKMALHDLNCCLSSQFMASPDFGSTMHLR